MKTIILLLAFATSLTSAIAQKPKDIRVFIDNTKLSVCDVDGNLVKDANGKTIDKDILEGWQCIVTELSNGTKRIRFIKWVESGSDKSKLTQRNKDYVNDGSSPIYFLLSNEKYVAFTEVYSRLPRATLTFGALTIPIRIRPQSEINALTGKRDIPFEYTTDINAGISAGLRFRLNKNATKNINVLIGGSITSASADSASTKAYLKSSARIGLLTSSFSIVYQTDNLHLIFALGKDYPPGELYDKWLYTGRTWFGFGVGVNLFSIKKSTDTQ